MTTTATFPIDSAVEQNNSSNQPPVLSPCSPGSPEEGKKMIRFWDGTDTNTNLFQEAEREEETSKTNNCHEIKERERKIDEILSCLNGVIQASSSPSTSRGHPHAQYDEDEKVVDLWHLRQLAITRNGLVSATIRKRAWPKLVGANEHILTTSIASLPSHFSRREFGGSTSDNGQRKFNELADSDIVMIKKDIRECVWNIEEEIKNVRKRREREREEKRRASSSTSAALGVNTMTKRPKSMEDSSVASLDSGCSSITAGRLTPQLIPEAIRAFPRLGGFAVANSPHASGASTPVSGIATPNTMPSMGVQNVSINENSNVPSIITKVRTRSAPKRREEQALLLNIITSVLRAVPQSDDDEEESDPEFDDETVVVDNIKKLYYYKGMHNAIAPLLITLESPSLTSLIFKRLSQSHLKDAMSSTFENIQAGIRLIFMPLLQKCDKSLHDYIVRGGVVDPCVFALPWVLCWFTNDVTSNFDIISRLFDVFLASHASFPVYFSVAILTHPASKNLIMMTPCEKSALTSVICNLPSSAASGSNAMDSFEDMIETAVSYMRITPIQEIITFSKAYENSNVSGSLTLAHSVKMLKKPPSWAYTSATATDWTLIKQAKTIRGLSPESRLKRKKALVAKKQRYDSGNSQFEHYLALDASGLSQSLKDSICHKKKTSHNYINILFLLLTIGVGMTTLMLSKHTGEMNPPSTLEIQTNHSGVNELKGERVEILNVAHISISKSNEDKEQKVTGTVETQQIQTQKMSKNDGKKETTEPSTQNIVADTNVIDQPPMAIKNNSNEEIGLNSSNRVAEPDLKSVQVTDHGPNSISYKMKRIVNGTKQYLREDPELFFIYE